VAAAVLFGAAIKAFFWADFIFATLFAIGGCVMLALWVVWPLWSRSAKRSANLS
jgi:cytochrome b subunit of formate dehydrogenase